MPKGKKTENFATMSVVDVAELLGVTDRGVRKWIKEEGLPAISDPRGFTLDWPSVLRWYVEYKISKRAGTGGTNAPGSPGTPPAETTEQALCRRTIAEADLKELQLARESGQVASIADVARILAGANKSIQTLLLSLPTALTPRLIGLDDRNEIYGLLDQGIRDALTNVATLDAIREAHRQAAASEEAAE